MSAFILNGLVFIFIPLGVFFIFGWLIFFHLKKYGIEGDSSKIFSLFFSLIIIFISLLIITVFLTIEWDKASMDDFIKKSNIKLQPLSEDYDY